MTRIEILGSAGAVNEVLSQPGRGARQVQGSFGRANRALEDDRGLRCGLNEGSIVVIAFFNRLQVGRVLRMTWMRFFKPSRDF